MSKKGFTLIELLVYIAIFAVVAGALSGILATFVRIQGQEAASASVSQELSFIQTTIQRLVRESVNIQNPAGAASSTLTLRMASSTLDPTIISSDSNAIYLKQGTGATNPLTSNRVKISQFQVVKYENPGGHAVVQIDLSLTFNSQRLYQQITRNLKTSIGRISAATFDDNLIPNANNTWSIGISPYLWKNAAFSGDLTVGGNVGIGTTNLGAKLQVVTDLASGGLEGVYMPFTSSGSNAAQRLGLYISASPGYTGSGGSTLLYFNNEIASIANIYVSDTSSFGYRPSGNRGFGGAARGITTGINIGGLMQAGNGITNYGGWASATVSKDNATNVGFFASGLNGGTNMTQIGGYFTLYNAASAPTFESAALIADNGVQTSPIFLARDNGSTVFVINDGGNVGIGTTSPNSSKGSGGYLDVKDVYLRDTSQWLSQSSQLKSWESNWIAVTSKKVYLNGEVDEKGNTINLNHNLGSSSVIIQVLYAKDSGTFPSSPNLNTITYNTAHSDSNIDWRSVHGGTLVQGIKTNSIDKLVTGHENVAIWADDPISWNGMRESNGWVKIILLKVGS